MGELQNCKDITLNIQLQATHAPDLGTLSMENGLARNNKFQFQTQSILLVTLRPSQVMTFDRFIQL